MKKLKYILLLFLVVYGCREPFEFDYVDDVNSQVVIDGFITDSERTHLVRVSYSTTIDHRGLVETMFENNASVRIDDNTGNFTLLTPMGSGLYRSGSQYAAVEGRTYTLTVTLPNGQVYQSEAKTLPPPSPATARLSFRGDTRDVLTNNNIQQEEGAAISATIDKDGDRHFYQWILGHYFIRESAQAPAALRFCYVRQYDEARVVLLQDNPAAAGQANEYTYDIDFIPVGADMQFDFGFEGRLLTLNEVDFNFWDAVKTQAENSGGLFDAAPYTIEGNISNSSTGADVLGYFGVYRESIDRVFFTEVELGFGVGTYPQCTIPPFAARPHPCEDCRLWEYQENLGPFVPDWWRN